MSHRTAIAGLVPLPFVMTVAERQLTLPLGDTDVDLALLLEQGKRFAIDPVRLADGCIATLLTAGLVRAFRDGAATFLELND